jgi:hypothetical protein
LAAARWCGALVGVVFATALTAHGGEPAPVRKAAPLTIFVAKRIVTMEPGLPEATAVAVADGRIVDLGTLESLAPWMAAREHRVDTTFPNKVR